MNELSCNCGYAVMDENPSVVEAKMWYHAIQDHADMLKAMTEEQLIGWLTETHKKLELQS